MSNRIFGNQKYVDQLVSHYAAVNSANQANTSFDSLSPQDKVLEFKEQNPTVCCSDLTAPTGSIVLVVTSGSAVLTWFYTDTTQKGFNVEKSLDGVIYTNILRLPDPAARTTTDHNVSVNNTYYYRVNAFNPSGVTSYSNTASITFSPPPPVPSNCKNSVFPPQLFTSSLLIGVNYDLV